MFNFDRILVAAIKHWRENGYTKKHARILIAIILLIGGAITLMAQYNLFNELILKTLAGVAVAIAWLGILAISAYEEVVQQQEQNKKIEIVEKDILAHPEKPKLAWDLARIKLESYLDRNLSQVRSIYWLTSFVMTCGFIITSYGIYRSFEEPNRLPISVVSAASGVLISLIGGSFLFIYKSVLAQSKDYVVVLERINAVGMAVQVISNIHDENSGLRDVAMSELAKQLLTLYSPEISSTKQAR
ncbi:hypothetical protein [Xylophilus sp. Leaf220]|uniref:TRADD-N-associated membrane domain-containing protein n=1 Tax=Xylophilus sp. Leaf220 TaxID=1735686 RepID=UPI0012E21EE2|nr:hypothetical protein [Xylophilus sp. Leaf220]